MPFGLGGPDLNQLKDKDDIEDDSLDDRVSLVKTRTPRNPNEPSDALCISKQAQLLPANYRQQAFVPSKTATKILTPMERSGRKPLDLGPQPQSSLHRAKNQGIILLRKRGPPESATQNSSEDNRPKKQQKTTSAIEPPSIDTDDDDFMEVDDPYGRGNGNKGRKQKTVGRDDMPQSGNIRSKFFQDDLNLPKSLQMDVPGQRKPRKNEVIEPSTKLSRADSEFVREVDEIDIAPANTPLSTHTETTLQNNHASKWSSGNSNQKWNSVGNTNKRTPMTQGQKQRLDTPSTKFNLLCFQYGVEFYEVKDTQGLFIIVVPHKDLAVFYGEKGKEKKIWNIDLKDVSCIKSVHVNMDGRMFEIELGPRFQIRHRFIVFTLKWGEDIDKCKTKFFKENVGNTPTEKPQNYFDKRVNSLSEWRARPEKKFPDDPVAIREQDYRPKTHEVAVEIPMIVRRSKRKKPDGTDNTGNIPSERSRGSSAGELEKSLEEARPSKLELPKPRWKKSLVYPPTGPKREIVDYDDLSRLNSNQFLNDNIVNFYLRYIEVQLQKRSPELAKETYFLNTFFYERLTKKDEKGKREIDSVLKWTAKVDIFKTSYIVVPINESSHWYLAIICNLCNLERKMKDKIPNSPEGKSIDLESSGTLAETNEDDKDMHSRNALDVSVIAGAKVTSTPRGDEGQEQDVEIIETRDKSEHMGIDKEWPRAIENLEFHDGKKLADHKEVIELNGSSSQRLKPKGKGKPKAKEKSSQGKKNDIAPDSPAIIILDSMTFGQSPHGPTIKNLRDYLVAEALNKRNLAITKDDITAVYAKAPNQNNWYDCGLFLLHYVERFLNKPKEFVAIFLARQNRRQDQELWRKDEISHMRDKLFHLFIKLHGEQETVKMVQEEPKKLGKANGNYESGLKLGDGKKPVEDAMAMDAEEPAKDQDAQKPRIAPELKATSNSKEFEIFAAKPDGLIASDGNKKDGTPTNLTTQITDDFIIQPINLEEASNGMLQHKEVTLSVRDSQ